MLFVIFFGLLFLAAAAYFFGEAVTQPARERSVSVRRAARYGDFRRNRGRQQQPFKVRVVVPLGDRLAKWTLKLHPKTTVEGVSSRLLAAGLAQTMTPTAFLALKSGLALAGIFIGALLGGAVTGAGGVLVFSLALGGVGFIAPDFAV